MYRVDHTTEPLLPTKLTLTSSSADSWRSREWALVVNARDSSRVGFVAVNESGHLVVVDAVHALHVLFMDSNPNHACLWM